MLDSFNSKSRLLPVGWSAGFHDWFHKLADMRLFNRKSLGTLALAGQVVIGLEFDKPDFDVFPYVDPLIGTANGGTERLKRRIWTSLMGAAGHVFPGATLPFGELGRCTVPEGGFG